MHGFFYGFESSVFAFCVTRAHDGLTAALHHVLDIFEVDVDVACHGDNLSDTLGGDLQHVVGHLKSLGEFHVAVFLTELVVAYHEQCVDVFAKLLDAFDSLLLAAFAFE